MPIGKHKELNLATSLLQRFKQTWCSLRTVQNLFGPFQLAISHCRALMALAAIGQASNEAMHHVVPKPFQPDLHFLYLHPLQLPMTSASCVQLITELHAKLRQAKLRKAHTTAQHWNRISSRNGPGCTACLSNMQYENLGDIKLHFGSSGGHATLWFRVVYTNRPKQLSFCSSKFSRSTTSICLKTLLLPSQFQWVWLSFNIKNNNWQLWQLCSFVKTYTRRFGTPHLGQFLLQLLIQSVPGVALFRLRTLFPHKSTPWHHVPRCQPLSGQPGF